MKILIRLPNWLGDVVMSTAFISAVRQHYPDALIDVIIKKELSSLGALIPGLTTIHSFSKLEFKGLNGVYRFGKKFRFEKYDLFFNLPASLSSLVLGWASGAKKRVGFAKAGGLFLLTNAYRKPVDVHRVDEYISLLEQFTGESISNRKVSLDINGTGQGNDKKVLINFNSEADSRRMPLEKGRVIINLLTNTFTNATFTLIGSPNEAGFIQRVIDGAENADRLESLAGKTDLIGLCSIIANCAALLTTDSGPAHLANSFGTPVIVLFGAGNEHNTAPYNQHNSTVIRYGKLACEPCVRNTCELYGIPKCMELLDELRIIDTLRLYLRNA